MTVCFPTWSQHTKDSLKISSPAFELIVKDLQKLKKTQVAYQIQTADLLKLADTNLQQLEEIKALKQKNNAWQQQVAKQQSQLNKLLKKKSNTTTWLSVGAIGGLVLGVLIAN